ncbi:MAG: XRE family transcriptional regulator [Chryseobacterium sp.]|uniref:helix-turn-helix domain-containing protein n=1 Tax=Pedobacter agri TaxID=454586 RepID=UPI001218B564|nr:helix-turn-helix transcriptional regulator [Pedobacter agri]MDQ1139483.1 plasmid maintenance system antidote protein VapI [Pedobacter agri]RZJ86454.1 MAG: XRE family transcriptional regulator [Chryseobacterium sp.]
MKKKRIMKTPKHDMAVAARFKEFRVKNISKNSIEAGLQIGIPQSRISRIESGEQPVTMPIIKVLTKKFGLNSDWLLHNLGKPTDAAKKASSLEKSMQLQEKVDSLITQVKILDVNQTKLWNIVEQQAKLIEDLRNKLK